MAKTDPEKQTPAEAMRAKFTASHKLQKLAYNNPLPPAVQAMSDNLKWIKDMVYPPHIRAILDMQNQFKSMSPVVETMAGIKDIMQPYMQLQESLAGIQNSTLSRLAESMKGIADILPPSFFQNSIPDYSSLIPDIGIDLPETFWEDIGEEDEEDYRDVTEILEGVKEQKTTLTDAIQKLVSLGEQSLAEQRETNRQLQQSSWQGKLSLILTIISFLWTVQTNLKPETQNKEENRVGKETLEAVQNLKGMLEEETKKTTANLNLRTAPDTTKSQNILLTIPKGQQVTVTRSINHWCKVWYTDPETGVVRSGWVSKRYLK